MILNILKKIHMIFSSKHRLRYELQRYEHNIFHTYLFNKLNEYATYFCVHKMNGIVAFFYIPKFICTHRLCLYAQSGAVQ